MKLTLKTILELHFSSWKHRSNKSTDYEIHSIASWLLIFSHYFHHLHANTFVFTQNPYVQIHSCFNHKLTKPSFDIKILDDPTILYLVHGSNSKIFTICPNHQMVFFKINLIAAWKFSLVSTDLDSLLNKIKIESMYMRIKST